jgi:hypothetical protein
MERAGGGEKTGYVGGHEREQVVTQELQGEKSKYTRRTKRQMMDWG